MLATLVISIAAGCGKRANPQPPVQRIPAAPTNLTALRFADDVYVRVTVPTTNIDGAQPPDVGRIELYALTLTDVPRALAQIEPDRLRRLASLVASEVVRVVPRPASPDAPPSAPSPGVEPGGTVVFRERLTAQTRTPTTLPDALLPALPVVDSPAPGWPLGSLEAPPGAARHYFAVAVSPRNRYGPPTALQAMPLTAPSGAPSAPVIEVAESTMTLRWTPAGTVQAPEVPEADLLPSRSLLPLPPETRYEVFEISKDTPSTDAVSVPVALNDTPASGTELTRDHRSLGTERCFVVRAVDTIDGANVRGPASEVGCAVFADTFPPAPARDLLAASVPGAINLIWEASDTSDVDGYVVLRGEPGGATLTTLATVTTGELRYRDEAVSSGTRYVYAIVAVDRAGNRSAESNRVEETAR